ncbi:MAG: hypothetical protein WAT71_01415 [Ignavibacteria bacterium]
MFGKKLVLTIFSLIIFFGFSISDSLALSWFQKTTIKSDRSGTITLSYSAADSDLKGADTYKSLPFTEDKIRVVYSSDNNKVENVKVTKKNDTSFVSIVLSFKNIINLNSSQGFSKVKPTWYKNGDSTVFMYKVEGSEDFAGNLNASCTFELPTTEIMRSNGFKSGDNKFSLQLKPENFKNGYNIFAVFKNSADTPEEKTSTGKEEKESEGSCGLFGFEMPFIIGLGMLFMRRRFKK